MSAPNEKNTPRPLSFATFLESVQPGEKRMITDLLGPFHDRRSVAAGLPPILKLETPDIRLHCPTEICSGVRVFECPNSSKHSHDSFPEDVFLTYTCRNCKRGFKTYALRVQSEEGKSGSAVKYGEMPAFGPPLPARLLNMVGADGDLLRKGRRTENQSLGIGAFAYYRRVVENQKDRLLEEIRKAAVRLRADQELLDKIDLAIKETRFSKALDLVKGAIPDGLKVQGENPLKLLHKALSKGVHELNDEECLERAQALRVVLTELVSNIAHILKDDREVKAAVKTLQSGK